MKIDKKHLLNYSILIPYLILSVIGLVVIYSTTSAYQIQKGEPPFALVFNQFRFWVLSLAIIWLVYRMRLSFLQKKGIVRLTLLVEAVLLVISHFFEPVNGASGWIQLPGISLQPAEYLKMIMIWYLAYRFAEDQGKIQRVDYQGLTKGTWYPTNLFDWRMISLLFLALVVSLPDLGNATIVTLIIFVMVTVSGIGHRWFTVVLGSLVMASTVLLGSIKVIGVETVSKIPLFGYIAKRFAAFFNPFEDASDAGHQLINSYYAMSNGGWFGRGLGNSIEKNGYLPEAHTDFAFSIVIEELGLIGASLILGLLFFLIVRIILVGIRARNPFNSMMALGIGGMMLIQTFVNIGGISGMIPATGVTFPFLSQGGSSLLVLSIGIAFVLNVDANERRQLLQEELERTFG